MGGDSAHTLALITSFFVENLRDNIVGEFYGWRWMLLTLRSSRCLTLGVEVRLDNEDRPSYLVGGNDGTNTFRETFPDCHTTLRAILAYLQ